MHTGVSANGHVNAMYTLFYWMRPWLELVGTVVAVEFPNFDILKSFSIFKPNCLQGEEREIAFERLSQTYGVDLESFKSEFLRVEPYADAAVKNEGAISGDAWVQAYKNVAMVEKKKSKCRHQKHCTQS